MSDEEMATQPTTTYPTVGKKTEGYNVRVNEMEKLLIARFAAKLDIPPTALCRRLIRRGMAELLRQEEMDDNDLSSDLSPL